MPDILVFLLKINIALLIFCTIYYTVLRPLTFYILNRIVLIITIVFSTFYPFINLSFFLRHHHQLVDTVQKAAFIGTDTSENFVKPILQNTNHWQLVQQLFWIGVVFFSFRLIVQLFSLYKIHNTSKAGILNGQPVKFINADISPFSFWQNIYINPVNLNPDDIKSILQHEQIHIKDWHTLDIILAELSTVIYWFNPGVWFIRKAISENIEFITDSKVLKKGTDSKIYQISLLNVSFSTPKSAGIANHFNISPLKRRIIMMNKKKSSLFQVTKYIVILPILAILTMAFSFQGNEKKYQSMISTLIKQLPAKAFTKNENTKAITAQSESNKCTFDKKRLKFSSQQENSIVAGINTITDTAKSGKPKLYANAEDSVVVNKKTGITRLYENAVLKNDSISVHANYIEYNEKTKSGKANGSVVFTHKFKNDSIVGKSNEFIFSFNHLQHKP
jgi:bla regulator protein BlaR1